MLLMHPVTRRGEDMIGRDLDFDLHNAIQELIAEGLLRRMAQRTEWRDLSFTTDTTRLILDNGPFTTLS